MEEVHKANLLPWISQPLDIKKLINVAKSAHFENYFVKNKTFKEAFEEICPDVDFEKIKEECSVDQYYNPLQQKIALSKQVPIPKNINLKTLQLQEKHLNLRKNDQAYDVFCYNCTKSHDFPCGKPLPETSADNIDFTDTITLPEVMFTVQIYHPVRRNAQTPSLKISVDQEFNVTGQQLLTEFRDKIICVSDEALLEEWSEIPDNHIYGMLAKDLYKSGTFYFGTTFYNDCRTPNQLNYGQELYEWAKKSGKGIGPFMCKNMEKTRFVDLNICLGYPYVYIHQGDCEHIIAFTNVRLMTKDDILTRSMYPMRSRIFPKRGASCMICTKVVAKWIVTNCPELPEEPFIFCDYCFKRFNYISQDGNKIRKFEARVIPDRSVIL